MIVFLRYGGEWVSTVDGKITYIGGSTESCSINPSVTYAELVQEVADTLDLNQNEVNIKLSYQFRADHPPLQIRNNKTAKNFLDFISRMFPHQEPLIVSSMPISPVRQSPIFVISPAANIISPYVNVRSPIRAQATIEPEIGNFDNIVPPFNSSTGSNSNSYSMGPMSCAENRQADFDSVYNYTDIYDRDIGNIHIGPGIDCDYTLYSDEDTDCEDDDMSHDMYQHADKYDSNPSQHRHHDFDYNGTSIPVYSADAPSHHHANYVDVPHSEVRQINRGINFTYMPTLPDDIHPSYDSREPDIGGVHEGQMFDNKMHLQDTLAIHALRNKYQYVTSYSTKKRWDVKCRYENCTWLCRATKVGDSDCFVVKKINKVHTCPRDQVYPDHRQATARLIGKLQKTKFQDVNRVHRPANIIQDILEEFGINLSYAKAWRAKEYALAELMGSADESYAILPRYCEQLMKYNPGTCTDIVTDDNNRFKYFFMSLGAWQRAFRSHLRKVITVDGTFMKGKYYGTLFVAVCLDGNNQIYPLAFGIGDSENDATWSWFFSKLHAVIGEVEDLVIISDRHKSIDKAAATIFPSAHHGVCCQHLRQNFVSKFKKGLIEATYWKAAKAYRVSDFNEHMRRLRCMSNDTFIYLQNVGFHKWSRAHFPGRRYNIMTTNIAESINKVLKYARRLPITIMAEFIRATMQKWFTERVHIAREQVSFLTHWADVKVGNRIKKSGSFVVLPVDNFIFQVRDGGKDGLVNLHDRTCSCKKWQLSQLPCSHVAAVSRHLGLNDCLNWCNAFFTKDTLIEVYSEPIYPVPPDTEWESVVDVAPRVVLPPIRFRRPAGRPRVQRMPSTGETVQTRKCGRCGQIGHYRQNCSNPMPVRSMSRGTTSSNS